MKGETKLFLGIVIFTVVLIGGALYFLTKPQPTTSPKVDASLLVRVDSNKIASESAVVTLVEFGDYQCPACGAYHPIVKQLVSEYAGEMAFVARHFPLESIHKNGRIASVAVEAAGKQGKLWEMHNYLYEHQKDWSDAGKPKEVFGGYAKELGLNIDQFTKDLESKDIQKKIDQDVADGNAAGVNSTPTFFLNNEKLVNAGSLEDFRTLIKAAILNAPKPSISGAENYHTHYNLRIVANGKPYDLTIPRFQSTDENELNPDTHLHDGNGEVVHIHKKGVTIGDLLTSIGLKLTTLEFMDGGLKIQSSDSLTVRMYVNDALNSELSSYVPQDLDRILIYAGNSDEALIQGQIQSIADTACIYSEKCPERWTPPTENCVGGLGTDCEE